MNIQIAASLAATVMCFQGPSDDPQNVDHLPKIVQQDIATWRNSLASAACLKVVCETEESWVNLHELDAQGAPRLVQRERFQIHSWMTPDDVWVVIFGYQDDQADTSKPVFQQYWSKKEARVWDRTWNEEAGSYFASIYPCDEASGPSSPSFISNGCVYSTVTTSWLAGPRDVLDRDLTVQSVAIARQPNIAIVPPDPSLPGVWLDVFRPALTRDDDADPKSLYRRSDFMLLNRDAQGHPRLREWRTIVTSDETSGGLNPQMITARRRFQYTFFDAAPDELRKAVSSFVDQVQQATPSTQKP